jgi:two-component system sensor histidine kinase/response regulator
MEKTTKLLLVEDEVELIKIVETYFRDEGYEVRIAMNAEDALVLLENFSPDVIVSDVRMGRMDGFQFLETLRKSPDKAQIPLIFLTILDDRASVERAKTLGAAGYLTKPFDVEDLHDKIREVLTKKS